jgi:hypothetical protein
MEQKQITMTKEEILYRLSRQVINGEYTIKCEKANEAMELYAKQQAIAFVKWVSDNEMEGNSEKLYNQFIEQSIK